MSYMSRLEDARRQLVAGDFLAAEEQYWQARAEWEGSRIRAPLLEKGVDPLLRLGGRLFGRDGERPVLTSFGEKADALRADLEDVAALHLRKTEEKLASPWDALAHEDVEAIALALQMEMQSRIFMLDPLQLWPATRSYLGGSQRNGLSLSADLLPASLELSAEVGIGERAQRRWRCPRRLGLAPRPLRQTSPSGSRARRALPRAVRASGCRGSRGCAPCAALCP
jgi:hypothetical protein